LSSFAAMHDKDPLLIFQLDEQRYALRLLAVDRVIPMVEITPLPGSPDIVWGIINVQGDLVPVFDIRRRFGCRVREDELSDQIVLAHTGKRRVALPVDMVQGVLEQGEGRVDSEAILPSVAYIDGVVKRPDGLILIHDLSTFLSLDEEQVLDEAMAGSECG
jgi:purine-binding chemotaxis protein CheW